MKKYKKTNILEANIYSDFHSKFNSFKKWIFYFNSS